MGLFSPFLTIFYAWMKGMSWPKSVISCRGGTNTFGGDLLFLEQTQAARLHYRLGSILGAKLGKDVADVALGGVQ
jgi:hypothetical protein